MAASLVTPTVSSIDHARVQQIASAGLRIRGVPPLAQFLAVELEPARMVSPADLPRT